MKRLQVKAPVFKMVQLQKDTGGEAKKEKYRQELSGELTVLFSLVLVIFVSLILAMMEGASVQVAKNYRRADMERAMECAFAEYQKKLWEEYHIFALDGSYETREFTYDAVFERFQYYGVEQTTHHVEKVQFLSDQCGQPLAEQIQNYTLGCYGLEKLEEMLPSSSEETDQDVSVDDMGTQIQETEESLEEIDTTSSQIDILKFFQGDALINFVMPKGKTISNKAIEEGALPSKRTLRRGKGSFKQTEGLLGEGLQKVSLLKYSLDHFRHGAMETYIEEGSQYPLEYEMEYLLQGKLTDKQNLEGVLSKIILLRTGINYVYLMTDQVKQTEVQAAAVALCTLIGAPPDVGDRQAGYAAGMGLWGRDDGRKNIIVRIQSTLSENKRKLADFVCGTFKARKRRSGDE